MKNRNTYRPLAPAAKTEPTAAMLSLAGMLKAAGIKHKVGNGYISAYVNGNELEFDADAQLRMVGPVVGNAA